MIEDMGFVYLTVNHMTMFQGSMVVEMNETSPLPIAVEMVQGCPASDAWLLLRRLKSFISIQKPRSSPMEPIALYP